jgi:hypothetical protein
MCSGRIIVSTMSGCDDSGRAIVAGDRMNTLTRSRRWLTD